MNGFSNAQWRYDHLTPDDFLSELEKLTSEFQMNVDLDVISFLQNEFEQCLNFPPFSPLMSLISKETRNELDWIQHELNTTLTKIHREVAQKIIENNEQNRIENRIFEE